jgi:uncharacterized protein (DUF1697 family)
MTTYVALLRAVNVGGTGKLPMSELKAMCEGLGFARVRTFIASGNVMFDADENEPAIKAKLEDRLEAYAGKRVPVLVRTAAEMAAITAADPFPDAHGSRNMVFFYDDAPPPDLIENCRDRAGEQLALGLREMYVDYGEGIRFTRLKIPGKQDRTGRNMNSVRKMAKMMADDV